MFQLKKAIEKYKGIPPYASELYGVYQPLLGWKSNLTKKWIQHGGTLIDPRIQSILNGYIKPGPQEIEGEYIRMVASPLKPGAGDGANPYLVRLTKDLNSELLNMIREKVQSFVGGNNGNLPEGSEWASIVDFNEMMGDSEANLLYRVNEIHRERLIKGMEQNWHQNETLRAGAEAELLRLMQYESQIAAFLLFYAEGQEGRDPNELNKLFFVQKAFPLDEILRPADPLARDDIDLGDKSGVLSPIGFVDIYRQYFFDLGTFLGEPVEHIWLAPGTTIELVEISTRKQIVEHTLEQMMESTQRSEREITLKDEISEALREENQKSTKLGVSQSNTVNLYVYQGTATANFGIDTTRTTSRETAYKQNRDQSEKLSNEIKQSVKSVFRTVTEITDTTSRRHVISNPTDRLINYELRRKMRRIGVQMQNVGRQLCWQVFIDEPGQGLGISNLVHVAEPADLQSQLNQKETPYPPRLVKGFQLEVTWMAGKRDADPVKKYIPLATLPLPVQADSGYEIEQITNNRVNLSVSSYSGRDFEGPPFAFTGQLVGNNQIEVGILPPPKGSIDWNRNINYMLVGELAFIPTQTTLQEIDAANAKIRQEGYSAKLEEQRLVKEAYYKAVRERIELASEVKSRPSWDLREEERTVVYRELIRRLMADSWQISDAEAENRHLSHVRSEIIRSLFDVDSMLYFVAPEWWLPREHHGQFFGGSPMKSLGKRKKLRSQGTLGNEVVVNWSDNETREDNYYITEKSYPARLGSSLGWLLQLDGDNLRNAFLNSPWVKAVIPIRPGREKAALKWLREVAEGVDGWNSDYLGVEPEFAGKKMGEVLEIIADRLERENSNLANVLEADKVFEQGFDPLAKSFDASVDPNKPFTQWISVLPTDQIVAVEYESTELFEP